MEPQSAISPISQNDSLFFSIVIPAHQEEDYITQTLEYVSALDYGAGKLEVFVIENASKDKTYEKAQKFESNVIHVVSLPKGGVSYAKNVGISKISSQSDWTIFLDADTILHKDFLKQLDIFLRNHSKRNYSVGTTQVSPLFGRPVAKFWFNLYDLGHRISHTSYSIQIYKSSILKNIHFDENLVIGEDLKLIKDAKKYGKFFFFATKDVYTSSRRFEKAGWWYTFFNWIFVALLPSSLQRHFKYKVIR
jgi:glycosyltransferase involved in cell wall biosynthesis